MKVLCLTQYGHLGASSRVRFYQYIPYLQALGIEVIAAPLLGGDYIKNLYAGEGRKLSAVLEFYFRRLSYLIGSQRFDLLWIEKELFPWLPAWGEKILSYLGIPYVVDYDDAISHRYNLHKNIVVRKLLGRKISKVIQRAKSVIVGNHYLADIAEQAGGRHVEYIPSVIDLDRYPRASPSQNSFFTIGWIGSPATTKYLQLVKPALTDFCKDGRARLVLVGSGRTELEGVPMEVKTWSEGEEYAHIQGFDVGIMPIAEGPWEQGKCGYKLIQYMAACRPVIASCVGANKGIVENGVNGFLVKSTSEWVRAFQALRDSWGLRESMGKAGRRIVESQFCVQVTGPRLLANLYWAAEQAGI